MRILFINPPIEHPIRVEGPNKVWLQYETAPPLGIMSLSAYLKTKGFTDIKLINGQIAAGATDGEILREAESFRPDVIGFTVGTQLYYNSTRIAGMIKDRIPGARIVFGGPHLTVYGKETVSQPMVDFGVVGEGEYTFCELLEALEGGGDFAGVPGLVWKRDSEVVCNEARKFPEPLDALPPPDQSLYDYRQGRVQFDDVGPTGLIITSRGCPYNCTFCGLNYPYYRMRSAESVIDEMVELVRAGYRSIDFFDDNFNVSRRRVVEICDLIRARKLDVPWSFRGRIDSFDEEQAKAVADAGCKRISFGAESGSQPILDDLNKKITVEQTRTAFSLAKRYGIKTVAYFMFGLPGETPEEARKTVDLIFEIEPDYLACFQFLPQPGSELYRKAIGAGAFPDYAADFARNPVPDLYARTWETAMSDEQVFKLIRNLMLRFYFRPSYLFNATRRVRSLEDFLTKARTAATMLLRLSKVA